MTAHDTQARREAAAVPVVLFGTYGRTVDSYRPRDEDLADAMPASLDGCRRHVQGPHLRTARAISRTRTGIVGISLSTNRRTGRRLLYVNLGSTSRKFSIDTLGESEAWRRAIALRREHLTKLALANAAILAARARNAGVHPEELAP